MSASGGIDLTEPSNLFAGTYAIGNAVGAAQLLVAGLPIVAGKTAMLTGFDVTGAGATAASIIQIQLTNANLQPVYTLVIPAGALVSIIPLTVMFPRPIPPFNPNAAHNISVPSFGAGNLNASLNVYGFYL